MAINGVHAYDEARRVTCNHVLYAHYATMRANSFSRELQAARNEHKTIIF